MIEQRKVQWVGQDLLRLQRFDPVQLRDGRRILRLTGRVRDHELKKRIDHSVRLPRPARRLGLCAPREEAAAGLHLPKRPAFNDT